MLPTLLNKRDLYMAPQRVLTYTQHQPLERSIVLHDAQLTGNFTPSHDSTLKSSTWRPILQGLFSSNTKEKKLKTHTAMKTISNRSTWRPNVVVANAATQILSQFSNIFEKYQNKKKQTLKIDSFKPMCLILKSNYMTPNGWFKYESMNIIPKKPC